MSIIGLLLDSVSTFWTPEKHMRCISGSCAGKLRVAPSVSVRVGDAATNKASVSLNEHGQDQFLTCVHFRCRNWLTGSSSLLLHPTQGFRASVVHQTTSWGERSQRPCEQGSRSQAFKEHMSLGSVLQSEPSRSVTGNSNGKCEKCGLNLFPGDEWRGLDKS